MKDKFGGEDEDGDQVRVWQMPNAIDSMIARIKVALACRTRLVCFKYEY